MPALIPIAVSIGVNAIWASPLLTGLATLAASAFVSNYQQRQAAKKAREQYNAAQVDRLSNVVTTLANRELVLGRVRKGGPVYFRGSSGAYREIFMMHIALAAHEIDGVEQIFLNDQPVTLDGNGYVVDAPYAATTSQSAASQILAGNTSVVLPNVPLANSVSATLIQDEGTQNVAYTQIPVYVSGSTVSVDPFVSGRVSIGYQYAVLTSYVRIRWDLGAPGAVADQRTKDLFPSLWTDAHKAQCAKLICEFSYNENAFPNGIPVVTAQIRGAKVYDPRTAGTAWSENPALLMRHVYQHPQFGGATVSANEDARFSAAANYCDYAQNYVINGVGSLQSLYRAGVVIPFGNTASSAFDDLAQAMAGLWAFAGGELYLRPGIYIGPVQTLTDADLATIQRTADSEQQDQVNIAVHRERVQKFNVVNPRIWDSQQGYKQVSLTPVKGAALITRDGGELAREVTMAAVTFAPQAQLVAGIMMRDARDPLTVVLPLKTTAYAIELFDTVQVTLDRYGWTNKQFIVMRREWDPDKSVVRLTLKETSAAIYQPDASFQPQGYALNTALPNPYKIDPPMLSAAAVFSGTGELAVQSDGSVISRVRVTWPALQDLSVTQAGTIEVQWALAGSTIWQSATTSGSDTQLYLFGPSGGDVIVIRARSKSSMAVSNWSTQVTHTVIGKTAAPSDVTSFAIDNDGIATWTPVTDLDVRVGGGYVLRWQPGNNTSWGDAYPLHDGGLTDSPYPVLIRPSGTATFLIKAVDSSGNESVHAAASVVNLGDPIVANVVAVTDYAALGYPGTIVNATVVAGQIVATADAGPIAWDANPNTAAWTQDSDPGWSATTYPPVTYTPDVFIVAAVDEGTQLTFPTTIAANSFLVAYRRDGDVAGWTVDTDPGWTADADPGWATPDAFRPWPGSISAHVGRYEFRITTQSLDTQSVISAVKAQLDVPDVVEYVGRISVAPGGSVVPITKTFRQVTGINLTLVADGGTARTARVEDLPTRTVTALDSSNTPVSGTVIATVQGF